MRQIRKNVFETNSSSTHSLTMCTKEEYDNWKNVKLLFDSYYKKFVSSLELTKADFEKAENNYESHKQKYQKNWNQLTKEEQEEYTIGYIKENKSMDEIVTYPEWLDRNDYVDKFYKEYTTKNNEKIVAFGAYGYDG